MADWQVGDLALCVNGGLLGRALTAPMSGAIYTVTGLENYSAGLWLRFDNAPDNVGPDGNWGPLWKATRFRKITPGAKIEGMEEPRRVKVDA